jgi:hypothetical protein
MRGGLCPHQRVTPSAKALSAYPYTPVNWPIALVHPFANTMAFGRNACGFSKDSASVAVVEYTSGKVGAESFRTYDEEYVTEFANASS